LLSFDCDGNSSSSYAKFIQQIINNDDLTFAYTKFNLHPDLDR